jgi:GNAT superfamily N-acetyltransferase
MATVISLERPDTPDAAQLIAELEAVLAPHYPAASRHGYSIDQLLASGVAFFVTRQAGALAGCGGVQLFGADYGEVKRMFVRPAFRGLGLGARMLDQLAAYCLAHGVSRLRLETGLYQTDAIRLYERYGFERIPPFGPYTDDPLSVYFEKRLEALPASGDPPMTVDRSFVELNRAGTDRLRALINRLTEAELLRPVGEHWTVAIALAHLAFWDRRVLNALDLAEHDGVAAIPDLDFLVNDVSLPLWAAIPPREAARLALEAAEAVDARLAAYPGALLEALQAARPAFVTRARHRQMHLDEVDAALAGVNAPAP